MELMGLYIFICVFCTLISIMCFVGIYFIFKKLVLHFDEVKELLKKDEII